jgi:hypothetical protein
MSKIRTADCDSGCCLDNAYLEEVTPLTAEEVEKAIEYIRQGWTKDTLERDGKLCSIGALNKARYGVVAFSPLTEEVRQANMAVYDEFLATAELRGYGWATIPEWNDADSTTIEMVEDAFITVAKTLRDQGR